MKPIEVGHADPVFDEDVIVRPVEPDVGRLIIRVVKAGNGLVPVRKAGNNVGEDNALAVFVERHLLVRDVDLNVRILDVERLAVSAADNFGHDLARVQRPQPLAELLRQRVAIHLVAHIQELNRNVAIDLGSELVLRVGNIVKICPAVCQRAHACLVDRQSPIGVQGHKRLRLFLRDGLRGRFKVQLRRSLFKIDGKCKAIERIFKALLNVKRRIFFRDLRYFVAVNVGQLCLDGLRLLPHIHHARERLRDRVVYCAVSKGVAARLGLQREFSVFK